MVLVEGAKVSGEKPGQVQLGLSIELFCVAKIEYELVKNVEDYSAQNTLSLEKV